MSLFGLFFRTLKIEEKIDDEMLFTDRSVKKKSRKRKKSKLLEATQSKKVKLESTPQVVPIVPPKSAEFWAWVSETTSSTPESSLSLLAEIAAKTKVVELVGSNNS